MAEPLFEVSAKDVASRFGFYTDEAMQRPVGIQRHGRTRVVMLSLKEYERLKRRANELSGGEVIRTEDLDDETRGAILNAEPGERSTGAGRRLAEPDIGAEDGQLEALRREIERGRTSGPGIPAAEVFAELRRRIDKMDDSSAKR